MEAPAELRRRAPDFSLELTAAAPERKITSVTTVEEIERSAEQLPRQEFTRLASGIHPRLDEQWAGQMAADAFLAAAKKDLMSKHKPVTSHRR